jgi:hypothetical protein
MNWWCFEIFLKVVVFLIPNTKYGGFLQFSPAESTWLYAHGTPMK